MISLLCPTRGRPANVRRLIDSATATAEDKQGFELVHYVDDDDPHRDAVIELALSSDVGGPDVTVIVGPRITLSECWNRCARQAGYDVMMRAADDIVFRTPGWDAMVTETFADYPDHIVLVYGDDGMGREHSGSHGFVHRLWIDTVGYLAPPHFSSGFSDLWLNEVAGALDRRRYVPATFEHLQPNRGTAALDQTHRDRLTRAASDDVVQTYVDTATQRTEDVAKLQRVITRARAMSGG